MNYFSLNNKTHIVDFKTATINGQAPDKGLYYPEYIPTVDKAILNNLTNYSNEAIAYEVLKPYVGATINAEDLKQIVAETFNFPIPLVSVTEKISSLELYHGPTLAFKDVGARFMSRCLAHFLKNENQPVTVLVATSGDTGGAVANGFFKVPGVEVVILYPKGKVSSIQEKQLTTLGENITAIEVAGNFDDCQAMVKAAFLNSELQAKKKLTSANSINVARWLPQQMYYFYAVKQWQENIPPVVCVPSGNFGNIAAGLVAYQSGLGIKHFIAATNSNDTVPVYMNTQEYKAKKAVPTVSNAMDVGDPSNFIRIQNLFDNRFEALSQVFTSVSISEVNTKQVLKEVYEGQNYLCDTHGAVAYAALQDYLAANPNDKGIFLETAHPVKFYDVVEPILGKSIEIPENIKPLLTLEKKSIELEPSFAALKEYLLLR